MMNKENILAPSLLAADFLCLGKQLKNLAKAGVRYFHLDVMDGRYVPSISFGMPVIESVSRIKKSVKEAEGCVLDTHLMIMEPERYIERFAECGSDIITVHAESCIHLDRCLNMILDAGKKAGIAINPATPVESIKHVAYLADMILVMSVNPGFGGQKFIPYSLSKISALKKFREENDLGFDIEVDGGIGIDNVTEVMEAGANVFVAGSAVFSGDYVKNAVRFAELIGKQDFL